MTAKVVIPNACKLLATANVAGPERYMDASSSEPVSRIDYF